MATITQDLMAKVKIKQSSGTQIPAILIKAQTDAKLTHLAQPDKTLATHKALDIFYNDISDLIDIFIETYMGLYPLTIVTEGSSMFTDPIKYFTNLYSTIDKERKSIQESFLQNQIDEIQQTISHTLYRLKYIKD